MSVVYIVEVSGHFGTQRLDIVKKSLVPKFAHSSCKQFIIWEYPDILVLKIINDDLT